MLDSQRPTRNNRWRKQPKWYENEFYPCALITVVCVVFVVMAFMEFVKECV